MKNLFPVLAAILLAALPTTVAAQVFAALDTEGALLERVQRELPQLDEKLYLQLFAPPEAPRKAVAR